MSIMSALVRRVFYPLWAIREGDAGQLPLLHAFDDIASLSPEDLRQRQAEALRSLMTHAYDNTDYYRETFDRVGLRLDGSGPPALESLPLLTKEIVRANLDRLIARNVPRETLTSARTGGSTGLPMTFMRDKGCLYRRRAQELYFDTWMGYRQGDKVALFLSTSHFDNVGDRWKAAIRNATRDRLLAFDPNHITDMYMQTFADEYRKFRPSIIKCFPNSLDIFAEFINRRGLALPSVKAVSCTGENLYAQQRQAFQATFGGEVFEKYATRECGVIACECRVHNGMHLFTDGAYVEILDEQGRAVAPGEMGRLVITDLFNRGMPLIRYEVGDMAVASNRKCSCGSPLPLIERVLGRDRDILYDGDGNPKPGKLFVEAIIDLDLAAQFQVIQTGPYTLMVKVVKQATGDIDLARLRIKFEEIMGPKVKITFEYTDAIARDPSGKFRYVMSLLSPSERPRADGTTRQARS